VPIFDVDPGLVASGLLGSWQGNRLGVMDSRGARPADITDGASTTILMAEDAGRPELWQMGKVTGTTVPAGWASVTTVTPINLDGTSADGLTLWGPCAINCSNIHEIYSFHPGGANAIFADGHTQFLKNNIRISVMAALVTRAGGEIPDPGEY
jgi:prepilin-type processing-associated H-X9-DG protein